MTMIKRMFNPEFCECLEPCQEKIWENKVTTTPYPSDEVANNFELYFINETITNYIKKSHDPNDYNWSGQVSKEDIQRNIAVVDIYYEDLRFVETIESEKDPIISFICDVGGTLGLWLGMSLMTVVEVLVFILCFFPELSKKIDSRSSRVGEMEGP